MKKNQMRPISPGEVLREQLDELGMTANALAKAISVPANRITRVLNETCALSPDTALRLARFFNTSAEFWMNLQTGYELRKAEIANANALKQIRPLRLLRAAATG